MNRKRKIEIVIKGGQPWGFRLQALPENRSIVTVTEVMFGGKADQQGGLKVGDHVININDIPCLSLADALQLIESAFRTLTVLVFRLNDVSKDLQRYHQTSSKNSCFPIYNCQNSSPIYENVDDFAFEQEREIHSQTCVSEDRDNYSDSSLNFSSLSLDSFEIPSENSTYFQDKWKHSNYYSNSSNFAAELKNMQISEFEKQTVPSTNHYENFSHKPQTSLLPPSSANFRSELNLRPFICDDKKFNPHLQNDSSPSLTDSNDHFNKSSFKIVAGNKLSVCCRYPSCYNTLINCKIHSPPERDTAYSVKHSFEDTDYHLIASNVKFDYIDTNEYNNKLEDTVLDNKNIQMLSSSIPNNNEKIVQNSTLFHKKYSESLKLFESSSLQPNTLSFSPNLSECQPFETMTFNTENYDGSCENEGKGDVLYGQPASNCSNFGIKDVAKVLDPLMFYKIASSNVLHEEVNFNQSDQKFLDGQLKEILNKTVYSFYSKSVPLLEVNGTSFQEGNALDEEMCEIDKDQNTFDAVFCLSANLTPPLPPAPSNIEMEILTNDEPLPPPPASLVHVCKSVENSNTEKKCHQLEIVKKNEKHWDSQYTVVNSATQTTAPCIKKDYFTHFHLESQNNLHSLSSRHEELSSKIESETSNRSKSTEFDTQLETSILKKIQKQTQGPYINSSNLPLTSAYFTTSVPKAKFLTRYTSKFHPTNVETTKEFSFQKDELISSITKKLDILLQEQTALLEELQENDELGNTLVAKLEKEAKPAELQKFRLHVEESEKITNLLSSLSGRLARTENALLILSPDASSEEKVLLEEKYCKLNQQYNEALHLQKNIEKRNLSVFLHKYLTNDDLADYDHFIKMKVKLLLDYTELLEKIKLGEEQLSALKNTVKTDYYK